MKNNRNKSAFYQGLACLAIALYLGLIALSAYSFLREDEPLRLLPTMLAIYHLVAGMSILACGAGCILALMYGIDLLLTAGGSGVFDPFDEKGWTLLDRIGSWWLLWPDNKHFFPKFLAYVGCLISFLWGTYVLSHLEWRLEGFYVWMHSTSFAMAALSCFWLGIQICRPRPRILTN